MTVVVADRSPLNYPWIGRLLSVVYSKTNFRISMTLVDELLVEDAERQRKQRE